MKVFSRIKGLALEVLSGVAYDPNTKGRLFWDSDTDSPCIDNGSSTSSILTSDSLSFNANGSLIVNDAKSGLTGQIDSIQDVAEKIIDCDPNGCDANFKAPLTCTTPFQTGSYGDSMGVEFSNIPLLPTNVTGINTYWGVLFGGGPVGNLGNAVTFALDPDVSDMTPDSLSQSNEQRHRLTFNKSGLYRMEFSFGLETESVENAGGPDNIDTHWLDKYELRVKSNMTGTVLNGNNQLKMSFPVDKYGHASYLKNYYTEFEYVGPNTPNVKIVGGLKCCSRVHFTVTQRVQAGQWLAFTYYRFGGRYNNDVIPIKWAIKQSSIDIWRISA